jgi:hypothetical protein
MQNYLFTSELWLPRPRAEVFAFFAAAHNLETITPGWLRFEVLTPTPIELRPGVMIDYRLRVHGLPIRWRTEILEWNPPHGFVDRQVLGPYHWWHHTHTFAERDGGTLCRDEIVYRPRGGALMNRLFVRRDIERIFAFRREMLVQRFT